MKYLSWIMLCAALGCLSACGDSGGGGNGDGGDGGNGEGGDDGGEDGGPTECLGGIPCNPDNTCSVDGYECQPEGMFTVGGVDDPITDHPDDPETSYTAYVFKGGYCTPSAVRDTTDAASCAQDATACDDCSSCIQVASGLAMCLQKCTPSLEDNDCAGSNKCVATTQDEGVCFYGDCETDDECHLARIDSNENDEIDPYDPDTNPDGDHLKYFTDADIPEFTAECNQTLHICEHSGTIGAEAGDPCEYDFQCEANGSCVDGQCTRFDCDLPGGSCAGDGVCVNGACRQGCTVADQTGGDPLMPHATCGEDQACVPVDATGTDGSCQPGNYNDIAANNVGAFCLVDAECYSPYGLGRCLGLSIGDVQGDGVCSVDWCNVGALEDECGEDATCLDLFGDGIGNCWKTCAEGTDCAAGQSCRSPGQGAPEICLSIGCTGNTDCATGICDMETGLCQKACTDAGDCDPLQACVSQQGGGKQCQYLCSADTECQVGKGCDARYPGGDPIRVGRCQSPCANNDACPTEEICAPGNETATVDVCTPWCGEAGQCRAGEACDTVQVNDDFSIGSCEETCGTAADCETGEACRASTMSDDPVCSDTCTLEAQCGEGETCTIPNGDTLGVCDPT